MSVEEGILNSISTVIDKFALNSDSLKKILMY